MGKVTVPFDHHTWVGECVEGETVVGQFDHSIQHTYFLGSNLDTSHVPCKMDKFTMHINIC
jgi:hypothetical protein